MRASFSSLSLVIFSKMAFMLAISSPRLVEPAILVGMTIVLEDSASVSNMRAPFGEGDEDSLHRIYERVIPSSSSSKLAQQLLRGHVFL